MFGSRFWLVVLCCAVLCCHWCVIYDTKVTPIVVGSTHKIGVLQVSLHIGICEGMDKLFRCSDCFFKKSGLNHTAIICHITKCCWDQDKDRTRPSTSQTNANERRQLINIGPSVNKQLYIKSESLQTTQTTVTVTIRI
jgi:hypothetical protein